VMYALAGLANPVTGWGLAGDTFNALGALNRLGGAPWFQVGDLDLATHLRRTQLLAEGMRLTEATASIAAALGVRQRILPMSDDPVATKVTTDEGEIDFQDYFVRRSCEPVVSGFRFDGIDTAQAAPEALEALRAADAVVIGPSNPFVSIEPILQLPEVRAAIRARPALAVTPIVGGQAIKGPAAKMLLELGLGVSALAVASRYAPDVAGFVLDEVDAGLAGAIAATGLTVHVAQTVMRSETDRADLARDVLAFLAELSPRGSG
jgi:LPPG:FO 2-phospho-L-lactate transferase